MPSFPDSVFAPANRSNGQTIDASHINGVQDEIVAIEGGYINGTARMNSSALNVTGTSTFASRPLMPPPDCVKLGIVDALELAQNTTQAISWTRQDIAINSSMHSTTTNPTRVTPQTTGVYVCKVTAYFRSVAGKAQFASMEDSSGAIFAHSQANTSTGLISVTAWGLKRIDSVSGSTQWFRAVVASDGSTNSLSTSFGYTQCEVWKL